MLVVRAVTAVPCVLGEERRRVCLYCRRDQRQGRAVTEKNPHTTVFQGSMMDFEPAARGSHDLTITAGVLIHT
jgi:hypothetical protein